MPGPAHRRDLVCHLRLVCRTRPTGSVFRESRRVNDRTRRASQVDDRVCLARNLTGHGFQIVSKTQTTPRESSSNCREEPPPREERRFRGWGRRAVCDARDATQGRIYPFSNQHPNLPSIEQCKI